MHRWVLGYGESERTPLRRLVYACIIHDARIFLVLDDELFPSFYSLSLSVVELVKRRSLEWSTFNIHYVFCELQILSAVVAESITMFFSVPCVFIDHIVPCLEYSVTYLYAL